MCGSCVRSQFCTGDAGHLQQSLWEAPDHLETSLAPTPHSGRWRETWCLHPLLTLTPPSLPALTLYSCFLRVLITDILSSSLRCCWRHGIWNSRADVIQVGMGGESCKPVVMDGTAWGKQHSLPLHARENGRFASGGVTASSAPWEKGKWGQVLGLGCRSSPRVITGEGRRCKVGDPARGRGGRVLCDWANRCSGFWEALQHAPELVAQLLAMR